MNFNIILQYKHKSPYLILSFRFLAKIFIHFSHLLCMLQ